MMKLAVYTQHAIVRSFNSLGFHYGDSDMLVVGIATDYHTWWLKIVVEQKDTNLFIITRKEFMKKFQVLRLRDYMFIYGHLNIYEFC